MNRTGIRRVEHHAEMQLRCDNDFCWPVFNVRKRTADHSASINRDVEVTYSLIKAR